MNPTWSGYRSLRRRTILRLLLAVTLAAIGPTAGAVAAVRSTSAQPKLPAACLPITGPFHSDTGNQYEVRFRQMSGCDAAVRVFRTIVGQTPPEKPKGAAKLWWEGSPGWTCEAGNGGRPVTAIYCESGDLAMGFSPIPQGLASPTTILIGTIADGTSDGRIFVDGSDLTDDSCVVTGPTVTVRGTRVNKYTLTAKSPDHSIDCGFAQSWLARMVRQTGRGPSRAMPVAPRGWKCYGTLNGSKAAMGVCRKNSSTSDTFFTWAPVS